MRVQAQEAYRLFQENPGHPSLNFKKLHGAGPAWSARFGDGYRVVGERKGDTVIWFWVGTHQAFDKFT